MTPISITVKMNGGLFSRNIKRSVREAMYQEALEKVAVRMERGGKGLGAQRNVITQRPDGDLQMRVISTRIYPRTRGTSWVSKNIAITRAMAPRVLRKAADRIVTEMG